MDALTADDPLALGRYTLLGRLGEGGQGVVYLGRTPAGEPIAVKALNPGLVANPEALRRFAGEVDHVRQVSSFCVAEVLDADLTGDRPYVVSEYVEGRSLQETVMAEGPRGPGQLRRLAVGTMTALAAIHAAGIVHRDLKPHNVLLGKDGPRVIDFGIARVLGSEATVVGAVIGTVVYMAPEQVRGEQIGPAADLFAWASTMAFAAGGRPPFGTGGAAEVMYRIVNGEPERPPLPADLREVVLTCLAKDPADRPTARDVLLRLIGDQPATPNGTTIPEDHEATVLQPPVAPTLADQDRTRPVATRRNQRRLLVIGGMVTAIAVAAALLIAFQSHDGGNPTSSGAKPISGTSVYTEEFDEQPNWDGYRFAPSAAADARTLHGYEPDKGDYALLADASYPRNPALSPVPAKDAATAEPILQITAPATIRELRGHGEIGLLCRWDEEDGSGYLFLLRDDGRARIVRYASGVSTDLASGQAKTPEKGKSVRLAALCHIDGKNLAFWVGDDQVLTATNPTELPQTTRAQVGVVVQVPEAGDNKIIAAYDSFAVSRP
jgi:serine/threonine protein kinase